MKKIALVTPVLPERGGIGNVAWHQARLLAARGLEVTVLTPAYAKATAGKPDSDFKIELIKPAFSFGNAAWVPSLKEKLKGFNTVILHYPFFGGAGAVLAAKKKYSFKLAVYYHMDVVGRGLKNIIFAYNTNNFLPRLVRGADLVLTSSSDLGEHSDLGKYWQNNNPKFQVLPIGVDINKFLFSDKERERIILFVGVLDAAHYFKGLEILIKAVALVKADSFKVMIVGDGDLRAYYEKLAEESGVKDKIVFAGAAWGQDKVDWMQKALVTVLPSIDSESFGIVLLESMACGTPVIATDLPGVRSVYENNISGFTVPVKDVNALAQKIEYALGHVEQMKTMGVAGRKLVEEKYDWEKIGDEFLTAISGKL